MKFFYSLLLSFFSFQIFAASSFPVATNLKTDNVVNPVGVSAFPYFGWRILDDSDEIQTAYQLIIASSPELLKSTKPDVWDSGKVKSSQQNFNYISDRIILKSDTRYYWTVRLWDKEDRMGEFAPVSTFVPGLNEIVDWSGASWINRPTKDKDIYSYFRKAFTTENKSITKAILYISASHSYEIYLNEKLCAKSSNFHYPDYAYYQAYDLTSDLIAGGQNQFGVFTHWYGGGQGRATGKDALLLKMNVCYADGSSALFVSDGSWKTAKVEMFHADQAQRNGEGIGRIDLIDSRLEIENWHSKNFKDTLWQKATVIGYHPSKPFLKALRSDLTRLYESEIKPISIQQLNADKIVIDLGKIYAGRFKINFNSTMQHGDTLRIVGGFVLNEDGTVSEKIRQDTKMESYFVLRNGPSCYLPEVYLGMRYLQIENYRSTLSLNEVSFITRNFEMNDGLATFESSSTMLNQVWNLMTHSIIGGSQEGLVDTPTREKGGFLSDGWAQGVPALTVFGDRKMNNRVIQEFFDSQQHYWPDGRYNAVYPNADGGRDIPDFTQQFLFWIWDYYLQTGNMELLKKHYVALTNTGNYLSSHLDDQTGLIKNLSGGKGPYAFGIIDWPADMRFGYDMETAYRTVINAYAYLDFVILAKIASSLNQEADAQHYRNLSERIKDSMNKYLINSDGLFVDGLKSDFTQSGHCSQQANAIPLALGLGLNENILSDYVAKLGMRSGMVTLRFLVESLGRSNRPDALYKLFTNTEDYGWANSITRGATFTWESWTALETNQSLSHPWGASGLIAMQNYFLGISTLEPQNKVIQIKPLDFSAVKDLHFVKGTYLTDQGEVIVEWSRDEKTYKLEVEIPANVKAKIYIPCKDAENQDKEFELLSGGQPVPYTREKGFISLGTIGSGKYAYLRKFY